MLMILVIIEGIRVKRLFRLNVISGVVKYNS